MRDRNGTHHLVDRLVRSHPVYFSARFEHQAMAQCRANHSLYVLG
jgi:hypothetical protein